MLHMHIHIYIYIYMYTCTYPQDLKELTFFQFSGFEDAAGWRPGATSRDPKLGRSKREW